MVTVVQLKMEYITGTRFVNNLSMINKNSHAVTALYVELIESIPTLIKISDSCREFSNEI